MKGPAPAKHLDPRQLRRQILQMAYSGQSVHIACAFSIVEIVSVLYSGVAHVRNPSDPERDFVILSKGHGAMAFYAAFGELAWIEQKDLDQYFKNGTLLRGLGESDVPGMEVVSGSLGHGLPIAVGIAYGLKRKGSTQHVYCIVGDGEMNEGSMWEAILFAGHHKLSNLTVIVDSNEFQAMGKITDVLDLEPFTKKFEAFGFESLECDGHDEKKLIDSFNDLKKSKQPQALVARTVKGKGISFMEAKNEWHYTRLNEETFQRAVAELNL